MDFMVKEMLLIHKSKVSFDDTESGTLRCLLTNQRESLNKQWHVLTDNCGNQQVKSQTYVLCISCNNIILDD